MRPREPLPRYLFLFLAFSLFLHAPDTVALCSASTVSFIGILYGIAPELVIVLLFYATIGTYGSIRLFGKTLASLAYDTSRKEGNLRYGLVRIQEHTESIASSRGGARELEVVMAMLVDVVEVLGLRIKWNCKLEVYSSIYSYLTLLMPTLGKPIFPPVSLSRILTCLFFSRFSEIFQRRNRVRGSDPGGNCV